MRVAADALRDEAERGEALPVQVVDLDPAWALWPPPEQCPKCWAAPQPQLDHKRTARGDTKVANRGSGEWDESEVLRFLKGAYDAGLWRDSAPLHRTSTTTSRRTLDAAARHGGPEPEPLTGWRGVGDSILASLEDAADAASAAGPLHLVVAMALVPLAALTLLRWAKRRKRKLSGAHKKVRSSRLVSGDVRVGLWFDKRAPQTGPRPSTTSAVG